MCCFKKKVLFIWCFSIYICHGCVPGKSSKIRNTGDVNNLSLSSKYYFLFKIYFIFPHSATVGPHPSYYPECHCAADNSGLECAKLGYLDPPEFKVITGDHIQDISGQNEENFYLNTYDKHRINRSVWIIVLFFYLFNGPNLDQLF